MPQLILPIIPEGATEINQLVSVYRDEDRWTYFVGTYPIYSHEKSDPLMFKVVTSQLIEAGTCRQIQIIKTFGVSKNSVIRSVNKLRKGGVEAFFKKRPRRRGGNVLTPAVIARAQGLLDEGYSRADVGRELNVKYDTLRKAIAAGRLSEPGSQAAVISKSSRTVVDKAASEGMGVACTRVDERVLASLGKSMGAAARFETCLDVPKGGRIMFHTGPVGQWFAAWSKAVLRQINRILYDLSCTAPPCIDGVVQNQDHGKTSGSRPRRIRQIAGPGSHSRSALSAQEND